MEVERGKSPGKFGSLHWALLATCFDQMNAGKQTQGGKVTNGSIWVLRQAASTCPEFAIF